MFIGGVLLALAIMGATVGLTAWLGSKAKAKREAEWQVFSEQNQCKLVEVDLNHGFWRDKRSTYLCNDGVRYIR